MPQIVILPHPVFCPDGAVLDAPSGKSVCDVMLENDIEIEHACDRVCACTTCHVIVREGFESLNEQEEKEEDMLDKAWGLEPIRACRARRSWRKRISWSRSRNTRSTTQPRRTTDNGNRHEVERGDGHRRSAVREVPGLSLIHI